MTSKPIATAIAETIVSDLRRAIPNKQFALRIWQPAGRDTARIYTGGPRQEHLEVAKDGAVTRSHSRMAWGHIIDEVLEADPQPCALAAKMQDGGQ